MIRWETYFQAAQAYQAQNGHLLAQQSVVFQGLPLGEWLSSQRQRKSAGTLSAEKARRQRLEEIGMVWDRRAKHRRDCWEAGYRRALAYFRRNGHLYVLETHREEDGYGLGRWIRGQRARYFKGDLTQEQIERLEGLGMVWRVEQRVQTSFHEQAILYYVKQGFPDVENRNTAFCGCEVDILIPSLQVAVEYDSLPFHGEGRQAHDLRKNRRCRGKVFLIRLRDHGCPPLGPSDGHVHYISLEKDGPIDPAIQALLRLLEETYGRDLSHIRVDTRRDHAAISQQTATMIDHQWSRRLADAKAFLEARGHLDIPYGYQAHGCNLGSWLQEQRKAYGKGQLAPHKVQALEELGVKWHYLDQVWMDWYGKVQAHYRRHGHTQFRDHIPQERSLFHWKHDQLKHLRAGRLSPARTALLAQVGITAAYRDQAHFEAMCGQLARFREEFGHTVVPVKFRYDGKLPLGPWLQRQRGSFHKGLLPQDRVDLLTQAGFCPDSHQARFDQWVCLLACYRRENGHVRVPQDCVFQGKRLGKFINKVRVAHRKGQLPSHRVGQLEALGMVWYIPPKTRGHSE